MLFSFSFFSRVIRVNIAFVVTKMRIYVLLVERWICNLIAFAFLSKISLLTEKFFTLFNIERYPCVGAPFIISKPQFLDADEKLLINVEGLKPDRKEHDIFLYLEMV